MFTVIKTSNFNIDEERAYDLHVKEIEKLKPNIKTKQYHNS